MKLLRGLQVLLTEGPQGVRSRLERRRAEQAHELRYRQAEAAGRTIVDLANSDLPADEKFAEIYRQGLWVKTGALTGEVESLSGHGSSLKSTEILRAELQAFLDEIRPSRFFDAPCGDFNWMRAVNFPPGCSYLGGDIVRSVIEEAQRTYGRPASADAVERSFEVFDIAASPFPAADVWLCKDCLQHLSFEDVRRALLNFARSEVKYALLSNHYGLDANTDIPTGDFRLLDLRLPPFNLPPPERTLRDSPVDEEPRLIGVWTREQIAQAID